MVNYRRCAHVVVASVVLLQLSFSRGWSSKADAFTWGGDHGHGDDSEQTREELFLEALKKVDFNAVKQDITDLIFSSDPAFPSDYNNYGPFFIRLAWHCAGTYRKFDGEGGCDGGRQRFEPEQSWADNTNLDKARHLLFPIKQKYGLGLSWGDLITLTGTTAIEVMGAPNLGFCAGRVDDINGEESLILGPTDQQERTAPCPPEQNGDCQPPMGDNTLELIYVDPHGFKGNPDPPLSVHPVRDTFSRMGMNDSETVALIGGGHSFGKTHGPCPDGPGEPPRVNPENPWAGECGTGIGADTFTSGFEGPWTSTPTQWDTLFFHYIRDFTFEQFTGPAGTEYFRFDKSVHPDAPDAPAPHGEGRQHIIMLPTDLALLHDESFYESVNLFADDIDALGYAFKHAWYKLMTRDMGPVSRCVGPFTPPVQEFQAPLPKDNSRFRSYRSLEDKVERVISRNKGSLALLTELAYLCAQTHRVTDHHGGCNGARIRLSPEKDWPDRKGMSNPLALLEGIQNDYHRTKPSIADLIVFAGSIALEKAAKDKLGLEFCPGRVDADSAPVSDQLKLFQYDDKRIELERQARLFGMKVNEVVALMARPRSAEYMKGLGYSGSYTDDENWLNNEYFQLLLNEKWTKKECGDDCPVLGPEYVNEDGTKYMTHKDIVLLLDAEALAAVFDYAANNDLLIQRFASAWTKLMNADRFDGPVENLCTNGKVDLITVGRRL